MKSSSLALLAVSLAVPATVLVPWALFGDAVPRALMSALGPRALARVTLAVAAASLVLFATAVRRLWREARTAADPALARRKLRRLGVGIVVGGLCVSALVFGLYAREHDAATRLCRAGEGATRIAARRRALARAEIHRGRVAFFNESAFFCDELDGELARLDEGLCPRLPPDDAHCRCGAERFPEDWAGPGRARCDPFDEAGNLAGDGDHLHQRASWDPP